MFETVLPETYSARFRVFLVAAVCFATLFDVVVVSILHPFSLFGVLDPFHRFDIVNPFYPVDVVNVGFGAYLAALALLDVLLVVNRGVSYDFA